MSIEVKSMMTALALLSVQRRGTLQHTAHNSAITKSSK